MTYASRRKSIGLTKRVFAGLVGAGALAAVLQPAVAFAQDDPFSQFPLVIHCKSNETFHAFYISRVSRDGVVTPKTAARSGAGNHNRRQGHFADVATSGCWARIA